MRFISAATVLLAFCIPALGQETTKKGEIKAIAEEAIIYGFPMVMNYGVVYEAFIDKASSQYKCPFNQLFNTARVFTPKDTAVVTPNSDTPYSFFCADLRAEPVVFTIPEIEKGRYYSVQLVDFYTFNYGYVGSRTTGNRSGKYISLAHPGRAKSRTASTRCFAARRSSPSPSTARNSSTLPTSRT